MKYPILLLLTMFSIQTFGQYSFSIDRKVSCTPVKNQQRTGTCWSFATTSFIESEAIRNGGDEIDLSEMFIVRKTYEDKAENYFLRQGKANFSQGSLAHDLIRVMGENGLIPNKNYTGKPRGEKYLDHGEMEKGLKGYLDGVLSSKKKGNYWQASINALLNVYLGVVPTTFSVDGEKYTPNSYKEALNMHVEDYFSFTSFTHHPFYENFILELPDNYSNGNYYNIPLKEFSELVDYAISKGFSLAWDGDVSEKGFSSKEGIAILPEDSSREDMFSNPGKEVNVTQLNRQISFENLSTTDDHLMHLVGIAFDQNGNKYYIIKNSWGERGAHQGYIYMSAPYLQMKTIALTVHKDALAPMLAKKISGIEK